jgi:putative transposase
MPRHLEQSAIWQGLPRIIRTDNGPEVVGKLTPNWAHERDVNLRIIDAKRPRYKAYIERFDGKLPHERLNVHWFTSLDHSSGALET